MYPIHNNIEITLDSTCSLLEELLLSALGVGRAGGRLSHAGRDVVIGRAPRVVVRAVAVTVALTVAVVLVTSASALAVAFIVVIH